MSTRSGRQNHDRTETTSTDRSPKGPRDKAPVLGLAVVLSCDRPQLGGLLFSLSGVRRLVLGRGHRVGLLAVASGEARLEIPDGKASREHAALELQGTSFRLRDLGSRNGTHVDERLIDTEMLSSESLFRVGHTFFRVVPDAAAALERQGQSDSPWPFATLSNELAARLGRLERIAPSPLPILVLGETGAGKERIARAVHERSRRPGAFVAVNCGAIPVNLVESHLFGHKKGAFSGALQDEPGFVRAADGGTLFLDEVGDLPLAAQASLLRVLQEGEVMPVGASQPVRIDLRILCATHRPLGDMVKSGAFREDLFARLAAFTFEVPPLRHRLEDIGILTASLLSAPSGGVALPSDLRFHTDAGFALCTHAWPRNVRELMHAIQAAAMLAEDQLVRLEDLPANVTAPKLEATAIPLEALSAEDVALRDELIRRLADNNGNLAAVGREMGKARQQIQRWKRRLGIA